ncbi:hypothetical protein TthSNM11_13290 [Thermus thermophilus]|nr:hypothetical protein TthSNM11_13290 [Thermus thermophilus]
MSFAFGALPPTIGLARTRVVPGPESRRLWRQVAVAGEAACLQKWGLARHSTGGSGR